MRVSGWLYWLEQTLCALSVLWALGEAAALRRRSVSRLLATSAGIGAACAMGAACAPNTALLLPPALLIAPCCAWLGLPRRMYPRLMLLNGTLLLALTGLIRLMLSLRASPAVSLLTPCAALPLLARGACRKPVACCAAVELYLGRRTLTLTALVDTGNLLRDPLTGAPVIVIAERMANRLLDGHDLPRRVRTIRVRTVSGVGQMTVLKPDRTRVRTENGWREVEALVGVAPGGYGGSAALLPAALADAELAAMDEGGGT